MSKTLRFRKDQPENNILSQRLEAERGLIGCAMLDWEYVRQMCGWLKPERFHDEQIGELWRRITAGENPHEAALQMGCWSQMLHWQNDITNAVSLYQAPDFARQVARLAYLAEIEPYTAQMAYAVTTGDYPTAQMLAQAIAERTPQAERKARSAIEVGTAFMEMIDQPQRNVMTWIPPLDRALAGLERQTLSVVAARPSMGKSALAFQIARNVAVHDDKALFVSLEMAETNLWARAACPLVGLTWQEVRSGHVEAADREKLKNACSDLMFTYGERLLIHDRPCTTNEVWEIAAAEKLVLVIVDHLRLLGDPGDNENQRLGDITWRLKQMAKVLDCHVLAVAQLNRKPDARGDSDKRPQLTDLRDSGEIEENADLVLMLYREGYYKPEKENGSGTSAVEIWVRKARDGIRDMQILMTYDLRKQWFEPK